jgi:hypothetical protein
MSRKKKSQISYSIPALAIFIIITCVAGFLNYPGNIPVILLSVSGVIVSLLIIVSWALEPFSFNSWFDPSTNATLTCKNGHKSRVWVDLSGRSSIYLERREIIYNVDGHDVRKYSIITPELCPECGAEWLVPDKHHKHARK